MRLLNTKNKKLYQICIKMILYISKNYIWVFYLNMYIINKAKENEKDYCLENVKLYLSDLHYSK